MLLHGPTGSGKTEVYLQACAVALERGLGAIVLVPEIALTPQTVGRFRARFGDRVAVLHSALTRRRAPRRARADRARRGAGRRSAPARRSSRPSPDLGLVVVDEEHDASFKQESDPRYDARTVAAKRAALEGAVAVYGSATPRVRELGAARAAGAPARIGAPLPTVKLVDLRREAGYPLSAPLLAELAAVQERGGRAILLLNRRGISGAIHCRSCGVSRALPELRHRADAALGRAPALPPLRLLGRAPASVPGVRVGRAREDRRRDAAARGGARAPAAGARADPARRGHRGASRARSARRSSASRRRARPSLIGTQMVAKGHHFPGVEVAAVVDADAGLAFPDFRAEERTFQLVTQLAGRSGRDAPGRVVVQTFQPDATPFSFALRHDVAGFLAQELARREELGYPPFSPSRRRSSCPGPSRGPCSAALRELASALETPGPRAARPCAAPPPAWPPPRTAAGEDDLAARLREPGCEPALGCRAGDAPRRPERGRRRRSAVALGRPSGQVPAAPNTPPTTPLARLTARAACWHVRRARQPIPQATGAVP